MVTVHLTEKQAEVTREALRALPTMLLRDGVLLVGGAARLIEDAEAALDRALRDHQSRSGFEALGVPELPAVHHDHGGS